MEVAQTIISEENDSYTTNKGAMSNRVDKLKKARRENNNRR